MDDALSIIDYTPQHKQALEDISLPWLLEYDLLEPVDLEMLADPERFLAGGGRVLLACWEGEIVGMVMLELQGEGLCEALKFGVKEPGRWVRPPLWSPPTTSSRMPCGSMRTLAFNTPRIPTSGFSSPTSEWSCPCNLHPFS